MTDFAVSWALSRGRFVEAIQALNQEQLNWRLHPGVLTLGEAAVHVAGVEVWFVAQLLGDGLQGERARVAQCATEGVVNSNPFPFESSELDPDFVMRVLEEARAYVEPVIQNPAPDLLGKDIRSALGPVIDGRGALARLGFHAGYHQGQAHLIVTAPGFPGEAAHVH